MFRYILMLMIVSSSACRSNAGSNGQGSGITDLSSCGNTYIVSVDATASSAAQSMQSVFALAGQYYPSVMVELAQSNGNRMSLTMVVGLSSWTFNTPTGGGGVSNIPTMDSNAFLNSMTAIPGVTVGCAAPTQPNPGVSGGT